MTSDEAVRYGITATAGVVTSAALVMVGVFSIFGTLTSARREAGGRRPGRRGADRRDDRARVLLPASMHLLGDWNWYLPSARLAAQGDRGAGGDASRRLAGRSGGAVNRTPSHRKTERESRPPGAILIFMDTSKNLAARAGRWSAQHRKKAIFGWLTFVILAVFIGGSVGTRTLTDEEAGIGESRRADKVTADGFPDKARRVGARPVEGRRSTDRPGVQGRRRPS